MKKIMAAAVVIIFGIVLFTACGQTNMNDANSNLLNKVKKSGKITIGTEEGYPPMEFRDGSGKLVGFDVDFSNEVARRLGVKSKFFGDGF